MAFDRTDWILDNLFICVLREDKETRVNLTVGELEEKFRQFEIEVRADQIQRTCDHVQVPELTKLIKESMASS